MGLVIDWVPNHMSASLHNPWWRDVLRHGRASLFARAFDVDWESTWPRGEGRLLLPILGCHYGDALERGEFALRWSEEHEAFLVGYWDHDVPLDPGTLPEVLETGLDELGGGEAGRHVQRVIRVVARTLRELPSRDEPSREGEREQAARRGLETLADLFRRSARAREHLDGCLAAYSGVPDEPGSFDRLDALLGAQVYRLSFWQTAEHEINYRRFFNISDLVGLRQEDPEVRERTHRRLFELVRDGVVTGIRIDHIDGLRHPRGYLEWLDGRLRSLCAEPPWVVVEKILGADESLPEGWPVAGTTGYDLLNAVNRVGVDASGLAALDQTYRDFTGREGAWSDVVYDKKKAVMRSLFEADMRRLERRLAGIAARDRHGCDVASTLLGRALEEATAALDVYRTYVEDDAPRGADREVLVRALRVACERAPEVDGAAFDLLERVLFFESVGDSELRDRCRDFVQRWQQVTSPVMAKGVEDTSLYVFNRLLSLNTVGGEPDLGALSVRELHAFNHERARSWPHGMSTGDTHDAKRGEDVRARLNVLAGIPERWDRWLRGWSDHNARHRSDLEGRRAPSRNDEVLIYQTLLGVWPPGLEASEAAEAIEERVCAYVIKALREAKERTSWRARDEAYEEAARRTEACSRAMFRVVLCLSVGLQTSQWRHRSRGRIGAVAPSARSVRCDRLSRPRATVSQSGDLRGRILRRHARACGLRLRVGRSVPSASPVAPGARARDALGAGRRRVHVRDGGRWTRRRPARQEPDHGLRVPGLLCLDATTRAGPRSLRERRIRTGAASRPRYSVHPPSHRDPADRVDR
jgi:(1->4)-alpha-D-glucan 1-alpha-D-glucosylmutase